MMSDLFSFDAEAFRVSLMAKFTTLDEARCRDEERAARSREQWQQSWEQLKQSLSNISALFADFADDNKLFLMEDESHVPVPSIAIPNPIDHVDPTSKDSPKLQAQLDEFSSPVVAASPRSAASEAPIDELPSSET
jgi:hypothetical protein